MLETVHLSHLPFTLPLYITLYRSVENAPFLRQQLLDGNPHFEYALIDASMIISRTHILAACFRALNDYLSGRLKSRNVHSEIVFALSPNNNMLNAFRKFGIQDSTTNILVIKVPVPPTNLTAGVTDMSATTTNKESIEKHVQASVQGTPLRFDDEILAAICDTTKVRKAYKIAPSPPVSAKKNTKGEDVHPERQVDQADTKALERAILGAIALRGAT